MKPSSSSSYTNASADVRLRLPWGGVCLCYTAVAPLDIASGVEHSRSRTPLPSTTLDRASGALPVAGYRRKTSSLGTSVLGRSSCCCSFCRTRAIVGRCGFVRARIRPNNAFSLRLHAVVNTCVLVRRILVRARPFRPRLRQRARSTLLEVTSTPTVSITVRVSNHRPRSRGIPVSFVALWFAFPFAGSEEFAIGRLWVSTWFPTVPCRTPLRRERRTSQVCQFDYRRCVDRFTSRACSCPLVPVSSRPGVS